MRETTIMKAGNGSQEVGKAVIYMESLWGEEKGGWFVLVNKKGWAYDRVKGC